MGCQQPAQLLSAKSGPRPRISALEALTQKLELPASPKAAGFAAALTGTRDPQPGAGLHASRLWYPCEGRMCWQCAHASTLPC